VVVTISVDNIAYSHLIGEQLRTRVEQFGHVELSDANLHKIQVDRRTYGVLLGCGLLSSIGAANSTGSSYSMLMFTMFACCVAAVVSELQQHDRSHQERALAALGAAGKSLLGAIVFVAMLGVANVL
jgi:hypothetical protein